MVSQKVRLSPTCSQTHACTRCGFHGNTCMKVSQKPKPPSQDGRKVALLPGGLPGHKDSHKHGRQAGTQDCGTWTAPRMD